MKELKGSRRRMLLEAIKAGQTWGMAIVRHTGWYHPDVYTLLMIMERQGLIRGRKETECNHRGPLRTHYRLTPKGERAL